MIAHQLHVYPAGKLVPPSLLRQDWTKTSGAPPCLIMGGQVCDVFFAELNGDRSDELIFIWGGDRHGRPR